MRFTSTGKTMYVAISDNHAVRIKAMTKPTAMLKAVRIFSANIKGWKPEHGGIFEKSHSKEIRKYLAEHTDVKWLEGGRPIDA